MLVYLAVSGLTPELEYCQHSGSNADRGPAIELKKRVRVRSRMAVRVHTTSFFPLMFTLQEAVGWMDGWTQLTQLHRLAANVCIVVCITTHTMVRISS